MTFAIGDRVWVCLTWFGKETEPALQHRWVRGVYLEYCSEQSRHRIWPDPWLYPGWFVDGYVKPLELLDQLAEV